MFCSKHNFDSVFQQSTAHATNKVYAVLFVCFCALLRFEWFGGLFCRVLDTATSCKCAQNASSSQIFRFWGVFCSSRFGFVFGKCFGSLSMLFLFVLVLFFVWSVFGVVVFLIRFGCACVFFVCLCLLCLFLFRILCLFQYVLFGFLF